MNKLTGPPPILVAHRGYSGRYPENTLLSYTAAYQHGARYMELDLQLTSDLKPMLHHDVSLERMAGVDLDIRDTTAEQIKRLRASYPDKFGKEFAGNRFTSLKKFCQWLQNNPDVITFVELKQESIERFGLAVFVDAAIKRILQAGVEEQCVLISFNHQVLEYTRSISTMRSGWVLPEWSNENEQLLRQLKPDFLFCDKKILPDCDESIWRGSWEWAIYNLDDVGSAVAMANRGMAFLETNEIGLVGGWE